VRRLRLEKAAYWLSDVPVVRMTEVALGCGFSTPALFSRNFRKYFGMSPREWQRRCWQIQQSLSKNRQAEHKPGQAAWPLPTYPGPRNGMDESMLPETAVEVRLLAPIRMAYVWHLRGYTEGIDDSCQRIGLWAQSRDLLEADTQFVWIPLDHPLITGVDKCRLLAGVILPETVSAADVRADRGRCHVGYTEIPGGLHACLHYRGSWRTLRTAFDHFYAGWLPDSGYAPGNRPGFIRTKAQDVLQNLAETVFELRIPVDRL
jgi:AraC family transcriptional regulator